MSAIGKIIREKREEKRWSQNDLARAIGVTAQAISAWENGRNRLSVENVISISKSLGCPLNELIDAEGEFGLQTSKLIMRCENEEEEVILTLWRKAPFKTKVEIYQKLSEVNTSQVEEL